ncbi:MAG: YeeE/YedE family protein [Nevskiaceae bacterium]|nr:MAG: YeeE/YedE family protein [Nevskiaceae bacterium]TBR73058.1 MAG: YeeE/YedE family protein [Nevskiaceae bacterium]
METITIFTPIEGLVGGVLIGCATVAWLWLYGRVTGISGIVHGAVLNVTPGDRAWRWYYLGGLVLGAVLYIYFLVPNGLPGTHFSVDLQVGWPLMILAGLLVGFGTRMGSGCTSGHGICGLSRFSRRSFVAVPTFMIFGALATFVVRHVLGL